MPRKRTVPAGKPGFLFNPDGFGMGALRGLRFSYAPDDGAGGGDAGKSGGDGDGGQGDEGGQRFTQAQVNALIESRLQRQRVAHQKQLKESIEGAGMTPENVEAFKEWLQNRDKEEQQRLEQKGNFDQIVAKQKQTFEAELRKRDESVASLRNRLRSLILERTVTDLLSDGKLNGNNPLQVAQLIGGNLSIDDETGAITVVDAQGNPLISNTGAQHTTESFLKEWLANNPHFLRGSGGGSGATGGKSGPVKRFTRSQLQNADFYKANQKEIEAARKAGLIEDDIS